MNLPSVKIKLCDVILAGVLISAVCIISFFLFYKEGNQAVISWNGGSEVYSLNQDCEFTVTSNGYVLSIKISDGHIGIIYSDCPDKVCVHTGMINRGSIICVPAEVMIQVKSGEMDNADFVIS